LVAATASDAHIWNLVYLQLVLEESGFAAANLGPCVPDELLIEHCLRDRPDIVVLSSVNGHGYQDGLRLIRSLRARPELDALPVVIGGKLAVPGTAPLDPAAVPAGTPAHVAALLAAGFDAVFDEQSSSAAVFRGYLDAAFPKAVHAVG
jgi:methylaspartate mutase sigma subunit